MVTIHRNLFPFALLLVLVVPLLACSGDSYDPTGPGAANVVLAGATVSVDGTVYNGGVYHHGPRQGTTTRFEAHLSLTDGRPVTGGHVWIDYRHGGGMMGSGRFPLFDDGTNGDLVPGDGLYCLEDGQGLYGFHHRGARRGEYRYDFWGQHHDGSLSNHVLVVVNVED